MGIVERMITGLETPGLLTATDPDIEQSGAATHSECRPCFRLLSSVEHDCVVCPRRTAVLAITIPRISVHTGIYNERLAVEPQFITEQVAMGVGRVVIGGWLTGVNDNLLPFIF